MIERTRIPFRDALDARQQRAGAAHDQVDSDAAPADARYRASIDGLVDDAR